MGPIDYNSALVDNGYAQIRQQTLSETMIILFIPAYMGHSVTMCIIESTWKHYHTEVMGTPWRLKPHKIS